ncbi:hypothetical protein KKA15_06805 [Patescibacteria group bacterium]|nr:hypothetical protein [Patescibacteria group bacterium]
MENTTNHNKTEKTNESNTIKRRIIEQQKTFLEFYAKYQGIVTVACKAININPSTFYDWMKKYSSFRKKVEKIKKEQVGFVEDKLIQAIADNNISAIIFYLKSKHPDYKPRQEITFGDKEQMDKVLNKVDKLLP